MMPNCRGCGRFTKPSRLHCDIKCYGVAQRGKSREDRKSPSRKAYVQVVHEGKRIYLHRLNYMQTYGEIPPDFIVHHKNENKRDNSPRNLGAVHVSKHLPQDHLTWRQKLAAKEYEETGVSEFAEFGW